GDLPPRAAGPTPRPDEGSTAGGEPVRAEGRAETRGGGGCRGQGRGLPRGHPPPETLGTSGGAGVQGPTSDREAVRAVEDGVRTGPGLSQGGGPDSGPVVPVLLGAAGPGVFGARAAARHGPASGRELALVSGGTSLPAPDHPATDRGVRER